MDAEDFLERMDSYWFAHNILMCPCNSGSAPSMEDETLARSSGEEDLRTWHHQTKPSPSPIDRDKPSELPEPESKPQPEHVEIATWGLKQGKMRRRRRKGMVESHGAAELEFQKLNGILDLGFGFGGAQVGERLVPIIPSLQRQTRVRASAGQYGSYFSGAWLCRIPFGHEDVFVKEGLRCWAHAVACSVR